MTRLRKRLSASLLALACGMSIQPSVKAEGSPAGQQLTGLAELARSADLVALAQVADTDYRLQRDIPVSGSAYLRLLIPYKTDNRQDLVEVYEKGLHEHECYFPNPTVFEEGRRYLLFLRRDPDHPERYRGLSRGCALDVLVDRDNRYAVRLPLTGLSLPDADLQALAKRARPMDFRDRYAVVADEDLPPALRDAMRDAGHIAPWPGASAGPGDDAEASGAAEPQPPSPSPPRQWIYTRGVPLGEFREMLRLEPED